MNGSPLASLRKSWLIVAALLFAIGVLPNAAQAQLEVTSFDIGATPNPVGDGFGTTLTAFLAGISGIPNGTVDFYISSDVSTCSADTFDLGTTTVNGNTGVASLPTGGFFNPGPQPICAIYTPAVGSPYGGATAGVFLLTVYQPAVLSVTSPGEVESGTAINFSFAISAPNGQPTPTGTVTLFDENTGTQLGQVTISNGTVPPINGVTLTTGAYYAYYGGDGNYTGEYNFGTVFQANGLALVNPAIFTVGSGNTTVTLTGLNFSGLSTAFLAAPNPTVGPTPLTTTFISPTQVQAVIPAGVFNAAGNRSIYVVTGVPGTPTYTTNSLQIQIVSPFSDGITVSANPTVFPYGTAASSIFGSTVTPTGTTDGGVPAGPITFSLNPTAGGSFTSFTAPLTQNPATTGSYIPSALSAIDTGSGKMLSADFNNDGYFDIVSLPVPSPASLPSGPYLQLKLSTGADTFASEEQVYAGCVPQDFAVGDLNNDGNPDIVVLCQNPGNGGGFSVAEYLLGNGDGSFQAPVSIASNAVIGLSSPSQIVVGDFNGDGSLDIAMVDGTFGNIQVLFNDAAFPFDGVYNPSSITSFDTSLGQVNQVAAADFNQDGFSDVALVEYNFNSGGGSVLILTSNGFGGFNSAEQPYSATTFLGVTMAVTDVNGDNYPDVVVADPGSLDGNDVGQVIIFENAGGNSGLYPAYPLFEQGAGSVTGPPFPVIGAPASNAAQAPGWNLLFSSYNPSTPYVLEITPLVRLGFNNWQNGAAIPMNLNESYNPDANAAYPVPMVASDVNGDGFLDATLFGLDANNATWLQSIAYNNGAIASLNNTVGYPTAGTYSLTANYGGNFLFAGGASAPIAITVTQATPTGSISGPPSSTYGTPVTFTANIAGLAGAAAPTGTVQFYSDGNLLNAPVAVINGVGTLTTTNLLAGSHTITATYSGDTNYLPLAQPPASGLGPIGITVTGLPFSLNLTSSTTQTTAGTVVTFTVTATGDSFPTFEQITLNGVPTNSSPTPILNTNGVATWSYGAFIPNNYSNIQAVYGGDGVFAPTSSNSVSLNVTDTPVSVTLQPNVNPDTYPTPVNLTSLVTSGGLGVPAGTVDVQLGPSNNPTDLGSGTLLAVNGTSGLNPLTSFGSSGVPQVGMASGDFNGDGIADLAWLQGIDGAVELHIALGNGDGTFQTPVIYATGIPAGAQSLVTGIFNQSLPKFSGVAVACSTGSVVVFLPVGDAAGDLTLSQTLSVSGATGVATADFNKDGSPDLVVIGGPNAFVYYGSPSGVFPTTASWSTSGDGSNFIAVATADFNKDGYADFAVSDNGNNRVFVYEYSPANGTFNGSAFLAGQSFGPIAAGDIDGDGYPDLAVVSPSDSTVEILINDKTGNFPSGTPYGVPGSPDAIAMADFNQDGFADVAVAGTAGSESGVDTTILLGSASGAMTGEAYIPANGTAMTTGDFNGDGNPDLAIAFNGITPWIDSSAQFSLPSVVLPAGNDALTSTFTASPSTFWASGAQGTFTEAVNQGLPPITWANPAAITYGTALSDTQLDATSPVAGTFSYTPPGGTVLTAGTQTLTANFTPTDAVDYLPNTAQVSIVVNQATTSVDWSTPGAITYGTALSATQLNATASVPGTFAYSPAAGTVLTAGTHTLSVTFTPTDATDYSPSTATVSIVVNRATTSITWANPAAITYGTALSAAQLNATASVPGTFAYAPAAGTVLGAGTHLLSVTFTPTDTTDYQASTAQASLVVNQAGTTITWATPAAITYGTALSATQLNATASVPGTFSYSPGAGTVLTGGTHTLNVTFTPTDSADYSTSTASVSIVVNKATTTVTWANPAAIGYGTALSTTQLDATASVPGTFVYTPATGTVLTAGTHTLNVTFTPTDTTDYQTATGSASIVVNKGTATITWANPAAITYGTALGAAQLNATASTPGTFAYNPAAGTVLPAGTHTLNVTFTPTDTTDYSTSTASASIVVNKATPTITWANPAAITYGTALGAAQLNATASTPGAFLYSPAAGAILTAGTHTLSVTFTPTDTTDYSTTTAQATIVVNQSGTTVTWATPAAITYGTALGATQLDATASVPGTFVYVPAAGVVLTAGTHPLNVTFTPTDTADYKASTGSVSIVVNKATPTITWANPAGITYGTALSATQLNATASVPGTFAYTPASGTVLKAGTHTLSVTFTPTDATDYATATGTASIVVGQATPTITWKAPAAITYGTALSATQLNATASVPGTFVYSPAAATVLTAGTHTLSVTFTPTDATDYTTQTASVSIVVNQATAKLTWATPAAITYGTALSATQLNATSSVPGAFTYSPAAGTVLTAGTKTLTANFVPTDTTDYKPSSIQVSIVVNPAGTTITWANPAAIAYGTALSTTQLDATASVPGTFVYTPAAGTVLTAGTHSLSVTFTPSDATDYSTSTKSVSIVVNKVAPTVTWANPAAITYGTALGTAQLNATASTAGTFAYTPAAGTVLAAGSKTLSVTFTPTDATDYTTATASVTIVVNKATPTITWTTPSAISFGTPLSATQLDATATPQGGLFTYTPVLGTVLPVGTDSLSVTYTPTDTADYNNASASVSIVVNPGLALTSISPSSGTLGSGATTITLTGTGFSTTSTVQISGTTIASTYFNPTKMTAVIPASVFQQLGTDLVTVTTGRLTTPGVGFTVVASGVQGQLSGPPTADPGQQPSVDFTLTQGYPLDLLATLTLSVAPATPGDPVDPSVQFSTGGTTYQFTIPANTTTTPKIQLQAGTLPARITITLTLTADGQDVTPEGLAPVVIDVPVTAPTISSVTLARNGDTLTVTIQGFSSTRQMDHATFTFTAADGSSISNPNVTVDNTTAFGDWYSQSDSTQYGSSFTYVQNFTLSNNASTISGVSVTLTNSFGTSNSVSAH